MILAYLSIQILRISVDMEVIVLRVEQQDISGHFLAFLQTHQISHSDVLPGRELELLGLV